MEKTFAWLATWLFWVVFAQHFADPLDWNHLQNKF